MCGSPADLQGRDLLQLTPDDFCSRHMNECVISQFIPPILLRTANCHHNGDRSDCALRRDDPAINMCNKWSSTSDNNLVTKRNDY